MAFVHTFRPALVFSVLLCATFGGGCCAFGVVGVGCPGECILELLNVTNGDLADVSIQLDDHRYHRVGLGSGLENSSVSSNYDLNAPVPKYVVVTWTTEDGTKHTKNVAMADQIPDLGNFAGYIVFKFHEDEVEVVPEPRWLDERNARLGKTTVP